MKVIYIHGINNKPKGDVLKCQWDTALFGSEMGERTRMAYWVNRKLYGDALIEDCRAGDKVKVLSEDEETKLGYSGGFSTMDVDELSFSAVDVLQRSIRTAEIPGMDDRAQKTLEAIAGRMLGSGDDSNVHAASVEAKVLPLPQWMRRIVTRRLTSVFLKDVAHFFYNPAERHKMEQSLIERLPLNEPCIVVAHSQGTMIAYKVLREMEESGIKVPLFLTLGSPLGITEVQDQFEKEFKIERRKPSCVGVWRNVSDRLDPVSIDTTLKDEYEGVEEDLTGFINLDSPRNPHSATGYLRIREVRDWVRESVGQAFLQPLHEMVTASDLVKTYEQGDAETRHEVLIQLNDIATSAGKAGSDKAKRIDLGTARKKVVKELTDMIGRSGGDPGELIDPLERFVSARLTRQEVEELAARHKELNVLRLWRNAEKRSLIHESAVSIHVPPARQGYKATGSDIGWAVLDTGVVKAHPHFSMHKNIEEEWDCTKSGDPTKGALDENGHGTHVAAIIAGENTVKHQGRSIDLYGMAPEARLHVYKVLKKDGSGRDANIIKALDHIANTNQQSGKLVIHGVNLSLGGSFDPQVFGCGHSPICQELRRLWGQGVLVVIAAGNEGHEVFNTMSGWRPNNIDLSISDPANLEEAVAVGAVNKKAHTYGVSYFSSRGPTADGRQKPDVVAPGEKIWSARFDFEKGDSLASGYVALSGTSMAAPHVSGLLASFLSVRREFIGYPDRVKRILLDKCVDLGRDPYFQGAGMPNLIQMLAQT